MDVFTFEWRMTVQNASRIIDQGTFFFYFSDTPNRSIHTWLNWTSKQSSPGNARELVVWTAVSGDPMHEVCIPRSIQRAWENGKARGRSDARMIEKSRDHVKNCHPRWTTWRIVTHYSHMEKCHPQLFPHEEGSPQRFPHGELSPQLFPHGELLPQRFPHGESSPWWKLRWQFFTWPKNSQTCWRKERGYKEEVPNEA